MKVLISSTWVVLTGKDTCMTRVFNASLVVLVDQRHQDTRVPLPSAAGWLPAASRLLEALAVTTDIT